MKVSPESKAHLSKNKRKNRIILIIIHCGNGYSSSSDCTHMCLGMDIARGELRGVYLWESLI